MPITLACIGGRDAYNLLREGALMAERLGPRDTPFGQAQPIYRCEARFGGFFFLSRHGETGYDLTPSFVNYRANLYALKDLGVRSIVSWSETRAISHNFKIGQYVVVDDLVDETVGRPQTFFPNQGIGHLRQWPVFCPSLRKALLSTLAEEKCEFAARGVYVCVEGPRHETPAEARKYASHGGELLGQVLASEAKNPGHGGEIAWNFTKFLVGRDGKVVDRFEPKVKPDDPAVIKPIEDALAAKAPDAKGEAARAPNKS